MQEEPEYSQDHTLSEELVRMANVLESGEVQRFHAVPSVPMQSVAQHAWGVTVMATFIKVDPSPNLAMACLVHDAPELYTGDIPFTAKREIPEMADLLAIAENHYEKEFLFSMPRITEAERLVLKMADMIEGLRWAVLNERVPDSGFQVVADRWFWAIDELFCCEGIQDTLTTPEVERAYGLFKRFAPYAHSPRLYESWEEFMRLRGRQRQKNRQQENK